MSRTIAVLGGGISGLSTAYFLKKSENTTVKVFEASHRPGGWIETVDHEGFLFEQGPRSLRVQGDNEATFALIESLGLAEQLIVPHSSANKRFIYDRNQLQSLPNHLWQIPFNPLMKGWIKALWSDWRSPKRNDGDESIETFFSRRLGRVWTDRLIDPFVSGIYAGDCSQLSMQSCFPLFDEWEQRKGSLLRGSIAASPSKREVSPLKKKMSGHSLFSFQNGLETLPRALSHALDDTLCLNHQITELIPYPDKICVKFSDHTPFYADQVISTLPLHALQLLIPSFKKMRMPRYASVVVVNLGYKNDRLPINGFGYLVPSNENSPILGCVWDSSIFPSHNRTPNQTRLTVMMGGMHHPEVIAMSDKELIEAALKGVHQQMGVFKEPDVIQLKRVTQSIPQFEVGYNEWKIKMLEEGKNFSPLLTISGNAISGVSVHDCIRFASSTHSS